MVYLAGPNTQQQAEHLSGMPVLLSFAYYSKWCDQYQPTFSRILIDSGAFSELNSGQTIDAVEYMDWSQRWLGHADAIAGLDDIRGDWRKGMKNFELIPWSFPTWHETDPIELVPELCAMARERKSWIGIGLLPPRESKEAIVRRFCEMVPEDLHIHGWALRRYANVRRLDSVDSTNWWRDAMKLRSMPLLNHLTYGETLEIIVKRYQRWKREVTQADSTNGQMVLGGEVGLVGTDAVLDSTRTNTQGKREQLN